MWPYDTLASARSKSKNRHGWAQTMGVWLRSLAAQTVRLSKMVAIAFSLQYEPVVLMIPLALLGARKRNVHQTYFDVITSANLTLNFFEKNGLNFGFYIFINVCVLNNVSVTHAPKFWRPVFSCFQKKWLFFGDFFDIIISSVCQKSK